MIAYFPGVYGTITTMNDFLGQSFEVVFYSDIEELENEHDAGMASVDETDVIVMNGKLYTLSRATSFTLKELK
jgi:hypothetical protein